jgi:hypothetical protein
VGRPRRRATPAALTSPVSPANRIVLARKFMQTLDDHVYKELGKFAEQRGVTIQGLIRAVIVPEWISSQGDKRRLMVGSQHLVAENGPDHRTRNSEVGIGNSKTVPLLQR